MRSARRWNWKTIGIVAGAALAIYVIVGVYRAGLGEQSLPSALQPMHLQNGTVINHKLSLKNWTFEYDDASVSADGNVATITGVHDGTYYRKGKPYLKLDAAKMTLNRSTLDFTATGRVHVERVGSTNESFDTDSVVWTNATKLLVLDHPAYFRTNGQTLTVLHVTLDTKANQLKIGQITGSVDIKP